MFVLSGNKCSKRKGLNCNYTFLLCFMLLYFLQVFDDAGALESKVKQLAAAVRQADNLVVYTGAGISTVRQTQSLPSPCP